MGTLMLGLLWGFWHLPLQVFQPNLEEAGAGLLSFAGAFLLYVAQIVSGAVLFTWVFNHARGSILLVTLMHAYTNAAGGTFPGAFFPALFPQPVIPTSLEIGMILAAGLVAVATEDASAMTTSSARAPAAAATGPCRLPWATSTARQ